MPEPPQSLDKPTPRGAARVLLLDPEGRVLLHLWEPAGFDLDRLWLTPGGGLEAGESFEQAALRELWEETGLTGVDLSPAVWHRRDVFRWGDRRVEAIERFFVARAPSFEVAPAALDPAEVEQLKEHRWWSVDEIGRLGGAIRAQRPGAPAGSDRSRRRAVDAAGDRQVTARGSVQSYDGVRTERASHSTGNSGSRR